MKKLGYPRYSVTEVFNDSLTDEIDAGYKNSSFRRSHSELAIAMTSKAGCGVYRHCTVALSTRRYKAIDRPPVAEDSLSSPPVNFLEWLLGLAVITATAPSAISWHDMPRSGTSAEA